MNGGPAWLEPHEDNLDVANGHVAENLANDDDQLVSVNISLVTCYAEREVVMYLAVWPPPICAVR